MTHPCQLPTFPAPARSTLRDIPTSITALGPEHRLVFGTMHFATALKCCESGVISPPSGLSRDPRHVALGYPDGWKKRLRTDMPAPYRGKVGDAVGLTVTPHTLAAFGSYSPTATSGATPVAVGDMAIAIVSIDLLIAVRAPMLFCDRSPTKVDAVMSDTIDFGVLPWDRIRHRKFSSREGDPVSAARYEAEVLVYGYVPLEVVRVFAVHDELAAERLRESAVNRNCLVEVLPSFFFGR